MIFVTVGTHEQPFDRLIKKVDELKEKILNYDNIVCRMNKNLISHNEEFNIKFNKEINKLFNKEKHNE